MYIQPANEQPRMPGGGQEEAGGGPEEARRKGGEAILAKFRGRRMPGAGQEEAMRRSGGFLGPPWPFLNPLVNMRRTVSLIAFCCPGIGQIFLCNHMKINSKQ